MILIAEALVLLPRVAVEARIAGILEQRLDELPRLAHRQRSQHQRVDDAEDCRVRANAQRQRDHDNGAERRTSSAHAQGVTHVSRDLVEPGAVASGSDALFRLLHSPEIEYRDTPRIDRRRSVAHVIRRGHVDERLQLVIQVLLGSVAVDQPADYRGQAMQKYHPSLKARSQRRWRLIPAAERSSD